MSGPGELVHVDIKKLGNIPDNGSCYESTLFTQTLATAGPPTNAP